MWNQNDTKYIIKRLILYIAISCIVFFGASRCAKAEILTDGMFDYDPDFSTLGPVIVPAGSFSLVRVMFNFH